MLSFIVASFNKKISGNILNKFRIEHQILNHQLYDRNDLVKHLIIDSSDSYMANIRM